MTAKSDIRHNKRELIFQRAANLQEDVSATPLLKAMDLVSVLGCLSWLTSLLTEEHGFHQHKGAFVDALALRYVAGHP